MVTSGSGTGRGTTVRIAGYQDAVEIGRGGFAVVYRARRVGFGQDVAIKVLDAPDADSDGVARVAREREILGLLAQHPNVVTLYDAGTTGYGAQYLVMEYLPGGSLADRVTRDGPLPPERVLDIAVRLCGALESAHRAGVLHRDIKPDNVLVSRYGEPVLADFGLARLKGGMRTRTGVVTATLAHAPPEVLDGRSPTVRSDLYSLASTLFTLLAGRAPFSRPGEEAIAALIVRVVLDPTPDLRPTGAPAELCAVLEHALAKDPDDRPPSALALGEAFQRVQRALGAAVTPMTVEDLDTAVTTGLAVPGPGPGPTEVVDDRPTHRGRRRGLWALLAAAVALVLVVAVAVPLLFDPDGAARQDPEPPRGGPGTVTYTGAVNPAPGRADLEVLDFGFTPVDTGAGGWVVGYGARVRNPNATGWAVGLVVLTVRFTDDRGVVVGADQEVQLGSILPGGTVAVTPSPAVTSYDGTAGPNRPPAYTVRPTRMNIEVGTVSWRRVEQAAAATITGGPAVLRVRPEPPGRFGARADVDCTLTSTHARAVEPVLVAVVLRDEAGVIVSAESVSAADGVAGSVLGITVPPGSTPVGLRVSSAPPAAVAAECYPTYTAPAG